MSLIAAIDGVLEAKRAGGVTFEVSVPAKDVASLPSTGSLVHLLTHLIVREDNLQMYGFMDERGRALFESLLSISGVGPKAALAVLSVMSPGELATAILSNDAAAISRAQGVGKRTAERIILELKGKIEDELGGMPLSTLTNATAGSAGDPALTALLGLGFSALEAHQALSVEAEEGLSTDDRIRRALQRIGRTDG